MSGRARVWSFLLFVIAAACYMLGNALEDAINDATGGRLPETIQELLVLILLISAFCVSARVLEHRRHPLAHIGFPFHRAVLPQLAAGLLLGSGMVEIAVLLLRFDGGVHFLVLAGPRLVPAMNMFALLAVAAMVEEVSFRGYPFQKLVDSIGSLLAVIAFSALFGLAHWHNPNATITSTANTALVGVLFAVAYLRTRALWLPWGIHFAWNFTLGAVFGLPVSGLDLSTWVHGSAFGPVWLTGGSYGVEGGIAGTIAIALGFGLVLLVPASPRPVLVLESTTSRHAAFGSGI